MYMKYNAVLRGLDSPVEFLRNQFQTICCGNPYCTTLHVINSLIVKTSKLTRAGPVYRGMSGRVLPETFLKPNAHNVRGGVEAAFMSTTTDREVAMSYAANAQTAGIVFEIQQGMVDRGADIAWCSQARLPPFPATPPPPPASRRSPPPPAPPRASLLPRLALQYPHEKEMLFAPLTGLEVQGTRVEQSVLLVSVKLSINLNALTLDQVSNEGV